MRYFIVSAVCGAALTGCGGSGGPKTIDIPAATDSVGGLATDLSMGAVPDTFSVVVDGTEIPVIRLPDFDNGAFLAFQGSSALEYGAYVSQADSSTVILFRPYPDDIAGGPSTSFTRSGSDTLPISGSATLTGDYQAIIQGGTATNVFALVDGVATLDVDFKEGTVSGSITDRVARNPENNDTTFDGPPPSFADMTLPETALDDAGSFAGEPSGGAITITSDTAFEVTGTYTGLLAGNGTEAVGGLSVVHNLGYGGFLEVGAFAAGH